MNTISAYVLSCILPPDDRDIFLALYAGDILGCEEKSVPGGDSVHISCYFKNLEFLHRAEFQLLNLKLQSAVHISPVFDQDWNAAWKASMEPARLTDRFWVSPEWLLPPMTAGDHWIKIEPKMAFGTGHHETTRLAGWGLEAVSHNGCGGWLLDVGCGSGVLGFAGDHLGFTAVYGLELDEQCRGNLAENKIANQPAARMIFIIGTTASLKPAQRFDCCVMNMLLTESLPVLGDVGRLVKQNGVLVWTGTLITEKETAITSAATEGFVLVNEREENEWWCGLFCKK